MKTIIPNIKLFFFFIFIVKQIIAGTVTIQYNSETMNDAGIISNSPNYNGGGEEWGNVTYFSSNNNIMRTYFRFPIPNFISNQYATSITKVLFKLYFPGLNFDYLDISINEVTSDWEEYSIRWNNRPNHDSVALDTITLDQDSIWIDFNITNLLKDWLWGEKQNYGVVVKPLIEAPPIHNLSVVWTSDYRDSSLRPILEITSPELPDTFINDFDGSPTSLTDKNHDRKKDLLAFDLLQNYPNPFNPTTTIQFALPKEAEVVLEIFNSAGQRIATLLNKRMDASQYDVTWDASKLPLGIYFYRIKAGQLQDLKKMILMK